MKPRIPMSDTIKISLYLNAVGALASALDAYGGRHLSAATIVESWDHIGIILALNENGEDSEGRDIAYYVESFVFYNYTMGPKPEWMQ